MMNNSAENLGKCYERVCAVMILTCFISTQGFPAQLLYAEGSTASVLNLEKKIQKTVSATSVATATATSTATATEVNTQTAVTEQASHDALTFLSQPAISKVETQTNTETSQAVDVNDRQGIENAVKTKIVSALPGMNPEIIKIKDVRAWDPSKDHTNVAIPEGFHANILISAKLGTYGPEMSFLETRDAAGQTKVIELESALSYLQDFPTEKAQVRALGVAQTQFAALNPQMKSVRRLTQSDFSDGTVLAKGVLASHLVEVSLSDGSVVTYIAGADAEDPYFRSMAVATQTTLDRISGKSKSENSSSVETSGVVSETQKTEIKKVSLADVPMPEDPAPENPEESVTAEVETADAESTTAKSLTYTVDGKTYVVDMSQIKNPVIGDGGIQTPLDPKAVEAALKDLISRGGDLETALQLASFDGLSTCNMSLVYPKQCSQTYNLTLNTATMSFDYQVSGNFTIQSFGDELIKPDSPAPVLDAYQVKHGDKRVIVTDGSTNERAQLAEYLNQFKQAYEKNEPELRKVFDAVTAKVIPLDFKEVEALVANLKSLKDLTADQANQAQLLDKFARFLIESAKSYQSTSDPLWAPQALIHDIDDLAKKYHIEPMYVFNLSVAASEPSLEQLRKYVESIRDVFGDNFDAKYQEIIEAQKKSAQGMMKVIDEATEQITQFQALEKERGELKAYLDKAIFEDVRFTKAAPEAWTDVADKQLVVTWEELGKLVKAGAAAGTLNFQSLTKLYRDFIFTSFLIRNAQSIKDGNGPLEVPAGFDYYAKQRAIPMMSLPMLEVQTDMPLVSLRELISSLKSTLGDNPETAYSKLFSERQEAVKKISQVIDDVNQEILKIKNVPDQSGKAELEKYVKQIQDEAAAFDQATKDALKAVAEKNLALSEKNVDALVNALVWKNLIDLDKAVQYKSMDAFASSLIENANSFIKTGQMVTVSEDDESAFRSLTEKYHTGLVIYRKLELPADASIEKLKELVQELKKEFGEDPSVIFAKSKESMMAAVEGMTQAIKDAQDQILMLQKLLNNNSSVSIVSAPHRKAEDTNNPKVSYNVESGKLVFYTEKGTREFERRVVDLSDSGLSTNASVSSVVVSETGDRVVVTLGENRYAITFEKEKSIVEKISKPVVETQKVFNLEVGDGTVVKFISDKKFDLTINGKTYSSNAQGQVLIDGVYPVKMKFENNRATMELYRESGSLDSIISFSLPDASGKNHIEGINWYAESGLSAGKIYRDFQMDYQHRIFTDKVDHGSDKTFFFKANTDFSKMFSFSKGRMLIDLPNEYVVYSVLDGGSTNVSIRENEKMYSILEKGEADFSAEVIKNTEDRSLAGIRSKLKDDQIIYTGTDHLVTLDGVAYRVYLETPNQISLVNDQGKSYVSETDEKTGELFLTVQQDFGILGTYFIKIDDAGKVSLLPAKVDLQGVSVDATGSITILGEPYVWVVNEDTGKISFHGKNSTMDAQEDENGHLVLVTSNQSSYLIECDDQGKVVLKPQPATLIAETLDPALKEPLATESEPVAEDSTTSEDEERAVLNAYMDQVQKAVRYMQPRESFWEPIASQKLLMEWKELLVAIKKKQTQGGIDLQNSAKLLRDYTFSAYLIRNAQAMKETGKPEETPPGFDVFYAEKRNVTLRTIEIPNTELPSDITLEDLRARVEELKNIFGDDVNSAYQEIQAKRNAARESMLKALEDYNAELATLMTQPEVTQENKVASSSPASALPSLGISKIEMVKKLHRKAEDTNQAQVFFNVESGKLVIYVKKGPDQYERREVNLGEKNLTSNSGIGVLTVSENADEVALAVGSNVYSIKLDASNAVTKILTLLKGVSPKTIEFRAGNTIKFQFGMIVVDGKISIARTKPAV